METQKKDYELIKKSNYFNKNYYLKQLNEVEKNNKDLNLINHYLEEGWKKGYNPSKKFNTNEYLEINGDIKEAGVNPLVHYLEYGKKENRKITNQMKKGEVYLQGGKLLLKNPYLLKKLLFSIKTKGLKQTLKNVEQNFSKIVVENQREIQNLENLISLVNKSNNLEIEKFFKENTLKKSIDIIIPVYNGYNFLENLFNSIFKNTSLKYRLIIGNDKSPDERILPFLEKVILENPNIDIKFINNEENLGFLKTVNKLLTFVENHVVILNTDTEVPKFWIERLMYPILKYEEKIASTTPFTNSGTICSFPNYLEDNEIYNSLELEKVDKIFKKVNIEETILEVPTGVGFCMGMNYEVIKKIGGFDEIYGKGYCEENDWCQRAIQEGYKNVHVTNLFVYHKHGASFLSEEKIKYIQEHHKILLKKFPNYDKDIQKVVKENKLQGLRDYIEVLLSFQEDNLNNILMIDHALGGGAVFYREDKINSYLKKDKKVILVTYNRNEKNYNITFIFKEKRKEFFIKDYEKLQKFLKTLEYEKIFLNSLVSYENIFEILNDLIELKKEKKCLMEFPIHDFFCISPDYNLMGKNDKYDKSYLELKEYEKYLKTSDREFKMLCSETNIVLWRKKWEKFLLNCENILCFSHSSEMIVTEVYSKISSKAIYIPHDITGTFENIYEKRKSNEEKVIGVLGNINLPKGRKIIHELVRYIEKNNLKNKIVLIGNIDVDIKSEKFIKTGNYKKEEVPKLAKKYKIDEFLIPSVWPETFSYTTDEIMQLGYPLIVFDIGAPAERVKKYEKGKVVSLDSNYKVIILEEKGGKE